MERTFLALMLTLAAGCAHKPAERKDASPAEQAGAGSGPAGSQANATARITSCTRDLDCGPRQLCVRNQCIDISAELAECNHVRVYFPFNSAELPGDVQAALDRSARCLKADHALHVTIEGNADERGTEEYNLALGDRRATTVARYLERLGASGNQLKTVSYGKENPLCTEHDEACWTKNRRAELTAAQPTKRQGDVRRK